MFAERVNESAALPWEISWQASLFGLDPPTVDPTFAGLERHLARRHVVGRPPAPVAGRVGPGVRRAGGPHAVAPAPGAHVRADGRRTPAHLVVDGGRRPGGAAAAGPGRDGRRGGGPLRPAVRQRRPELLPRRSRQRGLARRPGPSPAGRSAGRHRQRRRAPARSSCVPGVAARRCRTSSARAISSSWAAPSSTTGSTACPRSPPPGPASASRSATARPRPARAGSSRSRNEVGENRWHDARGVRVREHPAGTEAS